ncbi:MAG: hypothetical protein F6K26_40970 [Moorea sp. SIO2I5]|nr:hypothetical protein [Moorena sp. SIO2I5]
MFVEKGMLGTSRYAMKRFGKADATRTQSVAKGLSFRAYAIALLIVRCVIPHRFRGACRPVRAGRRLSNNNP